MMRCPAKMSLFILFAPIFFQTALAITKYCNCIYFNQSYDSASIQLFNQFHFENSSLTTTMAVVCMCIMHKTYRWCKRQSNNNDCCTLRSYDYFWNTVVCMCIMRKTYRWCKRRRQFNNNGCYTLRSYEMLIIPNIILL